MYDYSLERGYVIQSALIAIVVTALIAIALSLNARPAEPYGESARRWEFMDDERKAEIEDEAWSDYWSSEAPYFVVIALIPGAILFWGALAMRPAQPAAKREQSEAEMTQAPALLN